MLPDLSNGGCKLSRASAGVSAFLRKDRSSAHNVAVALESVFYLFLQESVASGQPGKAVPVLSSLYPGSIFRLG
jgi:hypothetical protein